MNFLEFMLRVATIIGDRQMASTKIAVILVPAEPKDALEIARVADKLGIDAHGDFTGVVLTAR